MMNDMVKHDRSRLVAFLEDAYEYAIQIDSFTSAGRVLMCDFRIRGNLQRIQYTLYFDPNPFENPKIEKFSIEITSDNDQYYEYYIHVHGDVITHVITSEHVSAKNIKMCTTEEEYFQNSMIQDNFVFQLQDFKEIQYIHKALQKKVHEYAKNSKLLY